MSRAGGESMEETLPTGAGLGSDLERPRAHGGEDLQLTRIGHYVLLHRVGQGAMGVVYAAYDESLDRKVAIKLLHAGLDSQPRLRREAQALARLSHQHVVQVYEVGEFEGAPFIAMEFVEGQTLRAWLDAEARSPAAILATLRAAGRGLVAAHEKGLVHRDFKPDNVMVGMDGRVVVMDFGLARGDASELGSEIGELDRSADLLPTELTQTGAVMGTPAYMAPEQFRAGAAGPASDQFGFCVTAWEALAGERPFRGFNLLAIESSIQDRESHGADRLPSWVRKVLERGLDPDPEVRWPSMEGVLDALADDPTRRRRTVVLSVLAITVLLAGLWGAVRLQESRVEAAAQATQAALEARCAGEGAALSTSWNADARAKIAEVFGDVGGPGADESWARTARTLDAYAQAWTGARVEVCLARGADEDQRSDETLARSARCLDERRLVFEALLDVWSEADARRIKRAPAAAAELPLISACRDPNWLAQQVALPDDIETLAAVQQLRARLEHAAALNLAAAYEPALVEVEEIEAEAEALGWTPLLIEAGFARGDLLERLGKFEEAALVLRENFLAAGNAGYDLVAMQSASKLTWTVGVRLYDHERGLLWAELAQMFIARLGLDGSAYEAKLLNALAALHFRRGEHEVALGYYERALAIRKAEFGPGHPLVGATLNNIGLALRGLGRYDEALAALREALAIRIESHGPKHPDVAGSHNNVSLVLFRQKNYADAREEAQHGLDILIGALGPDHPEVGSGWSNLGVIETALGEFEAAKASNLRGLEIKLGSLGPDHALVAMSRTHLGESLYELGELDVARRELEAALASPNEGKRMPEQRAKNHFVLAKVLSAQGVEPGRARSLAELAAAELTEAGQPLADRLAKVEAWLREHSRA